MNQGSVSAGLASVTVPVPDAGLRFPAEDHGRSLVEMAQQDLDAALQLLADRAQYITGANGAAIALRRGGKQDLQCRASIGPNAPELGALLSTEFGLSGESIRTRKALRCDDAERDARVNRDVCRQLGIASVVVMPVVHDDEVLGVFELFSGKAHAFGERDLSALERLSEMVETAVRLARAAEQVPEPPISDLTIPELTTHSERPSHVLPVVKAKAAAATTSAQPSATPRKLLLWSAPSETRVKAPLSPESDRSSVPPVLRSLRKCEACGFPVSAARALCVECEEKKWRGQLKRPQTFPAGPAAKVTLAQSSPSSILRSATTAVELDVDEKKSIAAHTALVESVSAPQVVSGYATNPAIRPPSQTFTLTAGLESSESWFSANKYILGAILVTVATVAAILFLR